MLASSCVPSSCINRSSWRSPHTRPAAASRPAAARPRLLCTPPARHSNHQAAARGMQLSATNEFREPGGERPADPSPAAAEQGVSSDTGTGRTPSDASSTSWTSAPEDMPPTSSNSSTTSSDPAHAKMDDAATGTWTNEAAAKAAPTVAPSLPPGSPAPEAVDDAATGTWASDTSDTGDNAAGDAVKDGGNQAGTHRAAATTAAPEDSPSDPLATAGSGSEEEAGGAPLPLSPADVAAVQVQLRQVTANFERLDDRMEDVERSLLDLIKDVKAGAGVTPGALGDPGSTAFTGASSGAGLTDDEDSGLGVINKLQSNINETLNSGYLQSIKALRETLLAHEWELHGKHAAARRGVANFEHYTAQHELDIPYEVLTALYEDPTHLEVIQDQRLRSLARSVIEMAVSDRYMEVYKECTVVAKELAGKGLKDLIPSDLGSAVDAAGKVAKTVLPIPGLLRGR